MGRDGQGVAGIETVSFDFGGTLAHEGTESAEVYRRTLEENGHSADLEDIRKALRSAIVWVRDENRRTGRIWTEQSLVEQAKRTMEILGVPCGDDLPTKIGGALPIGLDYTAYDDAEPALSELRGAGVRLVIVSNVSSLRNLQIYLEHCRLGKWFDALIASGTVGVEKPDPKLFTLASELSGTPVDRMLHVGDSYERDYQGAELAGLTGVLVDRKGVHADKQCRRISRLTELPRMLRIR